jgi:hypothetical protein
MSVQQLHNYGVEIKAASRRWSCRRRGARRPPLATPWHHGSFMVLPPQGAAAHLAVSEARPALSMCIFTDPRMRRHLAAVSRRTSRSA